MAVPTTDSKLAEYSTNFNTRGVAAPGDFGLDAAQMALYTPLHTAWMNAYNACKADGARSRSLVTAKDDAKDELLPYARELYSLIKYDASVSNANKVLIGVHVNDVEPSPQLPPALAPLITLISVIGRVGRYKVADAAEPNTRRRPANAKGVTILSYAGSAPPPANDPGWRLEGQTGKNTFRVQFANDVAPGTPCYVTAMWYNTRGQYSPACEPVQTYLQVGPVAEAV